MAKVEIIGTSKNSLVGKIVTDTEHNSASLVSLEASVA
jgi:hypothetical protein